MLVKGVFLPSCMKCKHKLHILQKTDMGSNKLHYFSMSVFFVVSRELAHDCFLVQLLSKIYFDIHSVGDIYFAGNDTLTTVIGYIYTKFTVANKVIHDL